MERPYICEIDISFPSSTCAQHARDVIRVDEELTDSVIKTYSLIRYSESMNYGTTVMDDDDTDSSNRNSMDRNEKDDCYILRVYV